MTDINSETSDLARTQRVGEHDSASPVRIDEASIGLVELLFFAYRDFTGEADAVLAAYGFGRAHHRVLHFVNRRPGLRVADLLDILRITKQSLARVLKQLVDRGFIEQAAGAHDRRERRLYPTPEGKVLAAQLARLQVEQVGRALSHAGADSEPIVQSFLLSLISSPTSGGCAASSQSETLGEDDRTDPASDPHSIELTPPDRRQKSKDEP